MTPGHEHGAEQFVGHDAPVREGRSDRFVYAELSDVGETPIRWEQLPARLTDPRDNTFEICCIPFFAYGLSLGDVVTTEPIVGHGLVERVVSGVQDRSGHHTLRVQFMQVAGAETARRRLREELAARDCLLEEWSPRMLAVDAAPDGYPDIEDILSVGANRDGYAYEHASPREFARPRVLDRVSL